MIRMKPQIVFHFTFSIWFVFTLIGPGTMLPDYAIVADFRQFVSGKTICCATPLEVLYGISLPECGKHCLSHPGCTVLSYQRRSLQCRLFGVDPTDSSFLETDSTFVMVPVTRLTEEMILPCSRSHCSGFNKCTVTNTTSIYCDHSVDVANEWRLVYETDDDGDVVSGREDDLISAFQSASYVRVYVPSWNQTFRIDVTIVNFDKNSTWNTFSAKATRVFYMFCTSGIYQKSLQYLSESSRPSDPDRIGVIGMKWFVRNCCRHRDNYPIYCHDEEGRETCGSLSKLQSVIRQGNDARIFSNSKIRLSFPILDEINLKNEIISAQMLRYVASYQAVYNGTNIRTFRTDDYHSVFFYLHSHGTTNILRWYFAGSKKGSKDVKKNIDWYVDTCWSKMYSHTKNAVVLDGSEQRLRASIMAGKIIRVLRNNRVTAEPDSVFVQTDGHFNVQLLSRISVSNQMHFTSNPQWVWQMISTTGFRHILRLFLGSYDKDRREENTVSVQWYADTRPWRKLFTISASGTVTTGSKEVLSRSLKLGGMLRLVVTFSNNTVMAFTADNIEFFGSEVAAQFVRYIGHIQKPDSSNRKFAPEPHWNLILVTTEGRLTSSLWDVKANRHIFTNTLNVTCSWFVN